MSKTGISQKKLKQESHRFSWSEILWAIFFASLLIVVAIFASTLLVGIPMRARGNPLDQSFSTQSDSDYAVKTPPDQCSLEETLSDDCIGSYQRIMGNKNANLAILGEDHNRRSYTADAVEKLTKDKGRHIIYLEEMPRNFKIKCSERGIPDHPNRVCEGWENYDQWKAIVENERMSSLALIYQNIFNSYQKVNGNFKKVDETLLAYEKNFRTTLLSDLKNFAHDFEAGDYNLYFFKQNLADRVLNLNGLKAYDASDISSLFEINVVDAAPIRFEDARMIFRELTNLYIGWRAAVEIISFREKNLSYENIFKMKKSLLEYEKKMLISVVKERNKELLDVSESRDENLYNIIITGATHIVDDNTDEAFAARFVHELLKKSKQEFVVYADSRTKTMERFYKSRPDVKQCVNTDKENLEPSISNKM